MTPMKIPMPFNRNNILLAAGTAINVLAAMATIFTGYSGYISPETMPFAGLAGMTFPLWLIADAVIIILDIIFAGKLAIVPCAALLASLSPILTFAPVNLPEGAMTDDEKDRSFTVLNYNVLNFTDNEAHYPDSINRTLQYILSTDADIVCLQECEYLAPFAKYCVTREQVDSVKERYPYYLIGRGGQSVFSKYPIMPIPLPITSADEGDMAAYRTNVKGHVLTIFNVHLQSIGLTVSDKELFLELTSISVDKSLSRIRSQLVSKLYDAYLQRARQARQLRSYIDMLGGNIILCGDFNDIPGCYALRTIADGTMKDAYLRTASGPKITYNANRFYFRIDHVLYQGDLDAVSVVRGNIPSSDHYPLLTTYVWKEDKRTRWNFKPTSTPLKTTVY